MQPTSLPPPPITRRPIKHSFARNYDENALTANHAISSTLPTDASAAPTAGQVVILTGDGRACLSRDRGQQHTREMCRRTNIDDVAYTQEASQNFLKRLPDPYDRVASPGLSPGASTMAAANASPIVVGRRRRGRRVGMLGTGQLPGK